MIWPFNPRHTTETGARFYLRDAAVADTKALVDFKHRVWRDMFQHLKDDAFFAQAEATTPDQITYWQRRIARGATVWIAEDLRDHMVGTIHPTTTYSAHTATLISDHDLGEPHELRYFYLSADATINVGGALVAQAVGDNPAVTWVSGEVPLVEAALREAGFVPLGDPVDPLQAPWQGVLQQAMVRA